MESWSDDSLVACSKVCTKLSNLEKALKRILQHVCHGILHQWHLVNIYTATEPVSLDGWEYW